MQIIYSAKEMQETAFQLRASKKKISFVPTMGFLHEGHLSLIDEAKKHGDVVVLSIFVNPTQFGPSEDFEKYPRNVEQDQKLAEDRGVDILFLPSPEEIYPPGHQTFVLVTELTRGLCGGFRPGHFRGVTTVVAILFSLVQPNVAIFGEKDYQQLVTIQRMVSDLHLPIEIIGVPTLREKDGLAMSSRNVYLSKQARKEALYLHQSIMLAQKYLQEGMHDVSELLKKVKEKLSKGKGLSLQYAEIADAKSLQPLKKVDRPARLLIAVLLNDKRLIDNGPLNP
jgi:pantoate--beta-alanine ligase